MRERERNKTEKVVKKLKECVEKGREQKLREKEKTKAERERERERERLREQ